MKFAYAQALCTAMIDQARSRGFKPVAAAVLDARGSVRAVLVEDGCSIRRAEVAIAKANAALAMARHVVSRTRRSIHQ